jgi:hypothetical protein
MPRIIFHRLPEQSPFCSALLLSLLRILPATQWCAPAREPVDESFANKLLGAASLDRLCHGTYRMVLDGKIDRSPTASPSDSEKGL